MRAAAALVVGVVLGGCSAAGDSQLPTADTQTSTPSALFDVRRLAHVNEAFPAGFVANPADAEDVLPQFAHDAGALVARATSIEPDQCVSLLAPTSVAVGTPSIGMRGEGPNDEGLALQAFDPVTPIGAIPTAGCDRMTAVIDDGVARRAVIDRIDGPAIEGAVVLALRVTLDGIPKPDFVYAAIVDGHALVRLHGRFGANYPAQQVLSDLLVHTVAVLRGEAEAGPTPAGRYRLAALSDLAAALPAGYSPDPDPTEPYRITPGMLASAGTAFTYGEPFTTEPQPCGAMLKPIAVRAGAEAVRVRGDHTEGRGISVGAITPVAAPVALPVAQCDRFVYRFEGDKLSGGGAVERIAAPTIEGATTFALKATVEGATDPEYSYVALVDDVTYVDVQARVSPDMRPNVLSDLLVKAVAAVRS